MNHVDSKPAHYDLPSAHAVTERGVAFSFRGQQPGVFRLELGVACAPIGDDVVLAAATRREEGPAA